MPLSFHSNGVGMRCRINRLKSFLSLDDYHEPTFTPNSPDVALRITGDFFWPAATGLGNSRTGEGKKSKFANATDTGTEAVPRPAAAPSSGSSNNISITDAGEDEAQQMTLSDLNLTVTKGHLVGVCGAVGAGKTSLLSAMLSQMRSRGGRVELSGSMGYVSQQAWIQCVLAEYRRCFFSVECLRACASATCRCAHLCSIWHHQHTF